MSGVLSRFGQGGVLSSFLPKLQSFARNNSNALLGAAAGIGSGGGGNGWAGFAQGGQLDVQEAERRRLLKEQDAQQNAFSTAYAGMGLPDELMGVLGTNPEIGADLLFDHYLPDAGPVWEDLGPGGPVGQRHRETGEIEYAPEYLQQAAVGPEFADENSLRTQFNGLTSGYRTVTESYSKVRAAAADPSAAGDLSMIFAFMKMLDPGSVVREQEFANAQNAAGVPDQLRNIWNRALNGERLSPNQRADFLNQAANLMAAVQSTYDQQAEFYGGIATEYGMDPSRIIPPTPNFGGQGPAQMVGAGETSPAPTAFNPDTGETVEFNFVTGQWELVQ